MEEPVVQIIRVCKTYGKIRALEDISFSISKGEFVILVGPSGAGKSTLVRLLIREELPSSGKIVVSGRDISRLRLKELAYYRRNVGTVFQDFKLLPQKTVAENTAFALEVAGAPQSLIDERLPKILRMVGLEARASNYPQEISGGESQRVSIARALIRNPKLLIADEPTGNLDPENTDEVISLLERINQAGTMVLLATHDKAIVDSLRKRVVTIKEGQLVSDQPHGKYIL